MPPGGQRAKADTGEIGSCWVNTVLYVVCSIGFLCGSLTMELLTKDQEQHSLITHLIALKHFPKSYVKCRQHLSFFCFNMHWQKTSGLCVKLSMSLERAPTEFPA